MPSVRVDRDGREVRETWTKSHVFSHRRPTCHHLPTRAALIRMSVPDVLRRRNRPAYDIHHTQTPLPQAPSSPPKPGDAHRHVCACRNAYSRVIRAQSVPARDTVVSRAGGAVLQVRGGTEGKGGGIEGADARQSAARSTAPRRTHAQTTSSCWNTLAPAGEASRPPTASVYRIKQELDADGGSAVVGDAIAIAGLGLRPPPRRRLAGSACCSHASLLD